LLTFKQLELKIRQEKEKLSKIEKKKAQAGNRSGLSMRRFDQEASRIQQHIKRLESQLKLTRRY